MNAAHTCLADGKALAAHAQQIGAYGVATTAPSFLKPARLEELVAFCAEVAGAAPELPFYYYHIPSLNGVLFPMAEFLARASERIPNLAGVKFTWEDLMDYGRCLALEDGRFDMLFGRDEILLSALVLGARGAIGSTYGFAAPLYQRVIAAFAAGDLAGARREQGRAMEMVAVLNRYGGLAAGKVVMKRIGLDCGPVRLPLRSLTEEECAALNAELDALGAEEYLSR